MRIHHIHFDSVESTLEAARREVSDQDFLLITADTQTQGRGTKGRPWHSPVGNVYLTLAVHRKFFAPSRLQRFPLEAGLALWDAVATCMPPGNRSRLYLKWPNDLLWEGRKAAGMLLETTADHVLIGLGINVVEAPPVSDGGTASACLTEAGSDPDCGPLLASVFSEFIQERVTKPESQELLKDWREKVRWDVFLRLRDRPGQPRVLPVEVNVDGHLRVRFEDGSEQWLVSEYLV